MNQSQQDREMASLEHMQSPVRPQSPRKMASAQISNGIIEETASMIVISTSKREIIHAAPLNTGMSAHAVTNAGMGSPEHMESLVDLEALRKVDSANISNAVAAKAARGITNKWARYQQARVPVHVSTNRQQCRG